MRLTVNDTELYFDVEGAEIVTDGPTLRERPTIVALHGGPGFDHAGFKPTLSALTDTAQIVYLDQRSQGRSARARLESCTIEQMADDAVALCRSLGIAHPTFLGHSFGGFVALTLAVRHPDVVGRLILMNTAEVAGHYFGKLAGQYDVRSRLGEIRVPTLVIVGETDWLCPSSAAQVIANGSPGAELLVIPRAGHFAMWEQPDLTLPAIRRFLASPYGVGGI